MKYRTAAMTSGMPVAHHSTFAGLTVTLGVTTAAPVT